MKKIVILGCENSHANNFLNFVKEGRYPEADVIGVYSDDTAAAEKLHNEYGVYVMKTFDEFVGIADSVIVTARHGDNHYKYAAPYIATGVPMFMDKPITILEDEALRMVREMQAAGVRVTGGSTCKHDAFVQQLKKDTAAETDGKTLGGTVRAPINLKNDYGDFWFYSQHLAEVEGEIFGRYPVSVQAFKNDKKITVVFRHENYDVTGLYVDGNYSYYADRHHEKGVTGGPLNIGRECSMAEFDEYYDLLLGGEQKITYADLIAPVFVLNAIERSLASGKEETVHAFEI